MRDRLQLYMMMPGAMPKLTRSARLSSCAPKRVSAPSSRAARPSSMSKIMAKTTPATALFQSPCRAKRMAVAPEHKLIARGLILAFAVWIDLRLSRASR